MKFVKPSLKNLLTKFGKYESGNTACFNKSSPEYESPGRRDSSSADCPGCVRSGTSIKSKNDALSESQRTPGCRGEDTNRDFGNAPYAFDIENATESNTDYRAAIWTGKHLQLTVMSIPAGEDTGIEMHDNLDQFIRIESGVGKVEMGRLKSNMNYKVPLDQRYAILIPAGTYHNIINTGKTPLKLYSIYTPKNHPFGTVDTTKADSEKREKHSES